MLRTITILQLLLFWAFALPYEWEAGQLDQSKSQTTSKQVVNSPENLATRSLVAWCIVPFDAKKRTPTERAEMLSEMGLRHLAYDWREEHVDTWDEELAALRKHDIELTAFWCSSSLSPAADNSTQRIVKFLQGQRQATQLWVMLPDHELAKIKNESERIQRAADAIRELAEQVSPLGCSVGLYNHGGWIGRPKTLVRVMEALSDSDNVGIVYNFHHAHGDLAEFPQALREMKPYLLCLNLNGTTVGGAKILPFGSGAEDAKILSWILKSEYDGPVGILDHRNEQDARLSLQQNIDGLKELLKKNSPK